MTDQIPADKVRKIATAMRAAMHRDDPEYSSGRFLAEMSDYIRDLHALLPTPPPPTLADMTEEERDACQWMQCEVRGFQGQWVLATTCDDDDEAGLVAACGEVVWSSLPQVTPRPDLPRMTWPGDTPAPAPALPDGWRLADHPAYGRVIVTNPTPSSDGNVYFVAPATDPIGNDWNFCKPAELTYLDCPGTPPSAEPAPEVHPGVTVGEPVTDPQVMLGISIDAPDGTVVVGHTPDYHPTATVKSDSTWQSTAGMRAHLYHALGALNYAELESVTVVRWGKETDQ